MNDVLTYIIQSLVGIAIVVIVRFLIPWIKTSISDSEYKWILNIIDAAVKAAEQTITDPKTGHIKKEAVTELVTKALAEKNIKIDADLLDSLIESAVFTMNKEKEAQKVTA